MKQAIYSDESKNSGCLYRRMDKMVLTGKEHEGCFYGARDVLSLDLIAGYIGV